MTLFCIGIIQMMKTNKDVQPVILFPQERSQLIMNFEMGLMKNEISASPTTQ